MHLHESHAWIPIAAVDGPQCGREEETAEGPEPNCQSSYVFCQTPSTKGDELDILDDWWEVRKAGGLVGDVPSTFMQKLVCVGLQAEALHDYQAAADDPEEFSFSKGDTFDVLDDSGRWWEVRKADGTTGTALSNCLRVLPQTRNSRSQFNALYSYHAAPGDSEEVLFTKGEKLNVLGDSGGKECGSLGDAPSDFLQKLVRAGLRAEALYDYAATADDPEELSFRKGDTADVLNSSGDRWEVRKTDGTTGIAPSNVLRLLPLTRNPRFQATALHSYQAVPGEPQEVSFTQGEKFDVLDDSWEWWVVRKACGLVGEAPSNFLQKLVRAEALYDYQAAVDGPKDLSFSKGDTFDVLNDSGDWWEVRKADGTTGTAPSNFLRVLPQA